MKTLEYSIENKRAHIPWTLWMVPAIFLTARGALEWFYPLAPGLTDNTLLRGILELPFYWIASRALHLIHMSESSLGTYGYSVLAALAETAVVTAAALSVWYVLRLLQSTARKNHRKDTRPAPLYKSS